MELYIVRHGLAGQSTEDAGDDERALTPKGRQKTHKVAEGLRALGCRPGRIATSPLKRAAETAQIIADVIGSDAPLDVCNFLVPGATAKAVADWLATLEEDSVMIVGHMPDTAEIAASLIFGQPGADIVFKKSAVCCISFEGAPAEGAGRLEWLLQPAQLCAIADSGQDCHGTGD